MSAHTSQTELKLIGKLILEGEMLCETGLHVGAGKGSLEIGGSDNPVVKDAFGRPYVPGSSLRGKIRSLLEQSGGLAVPSELVYLSRRKGQEVRIHQSDRPDDEICLLFGRNPGRMERVQGEAIDTSQATPARLAVFEQHADNLLQIGIQFVERFGLGMRAFKARHIPDQQARDRITLNHRSECPHALILSQTAK